MDPDEIRTLIEAGLDGSEVSVTGDGRHFQATVVWEGFDGLNMLAQHRAVYATLGDRFDTEAVHALSINTYTPAQWARLQA